MKDGYIKQSDRKKILLLTDDIRVHSGVAQIGREIVVNTSHRYNWVQLAGSVKHPDKGKIADVSSETNKEIGIEDAYTKLYPTDGYGTPDILREVIKLEKPDAIFLITDPRYFQWVFNMEEEIRTSIPIAYLNIWDDMPAPQYNEEFYESCDALFGISKQTVAINKIVLGNKADDKVIKYVPHGLDTKKFFPLKEKTKDYLDFRSQFTRGEEKDFILFFNSRNIRRKSIPDALAAWKLFIDDLTEENKKKALFILHTEPGSEHGTDLPAVIEYLMGPEDNTVVISQQKLHYTQMNYLYNMADAVILISAAEGWGLSLTESLLTSTPFIANVTGGMQDQMRFIDHDGNWYTNSKEIPSNHNGTFTKHGEWVLPVYPKALGMVGSMVTPYIWDSRCDFKDAYQNIKTLYSMSPEERLKRGESGRKWAIGDEAGFTAEKMANTFADGMEELFTTWKPRKNFVFLQDDEFKPRQLQHKLIY
jgi:glycosyltransferase involved in cell wall biosynthesis|tara:strand:- start:14680 stop:16110 length:1431 start_codon:yes stop_codon:yes gene_type:complete